MAWASGSGRAEERSVIRHAAIAMSWSTRLPWRRMADDGLRPLPPYASSMVGGGAGPWELT
ncbi:MAG: hypothetical protein EA347_10630 [Thioalkalivibrio sp.]|nr:MAG: hypothetical protein EA347_10630 [Thioalkalivibrio sp.]